MTSLWNWLRRKQKQQDFKPVILVTGCGSGIGLAIAELLYKQLEYRVVATARSGTLIKLQEMFADTDRFLVRELDLNNPFSRERLLQEIESKWQGVNILINNAGISYRAVVEHMTDEDEQLQMQTNYLGPVALIRRVLPYMRQIGRGKIINVSSVSGMLAMPTMASYSASKYALEGASEALWYEAKPLGISVSLIQPGFIHSNSFKRVYYTRSSAPQNADTGPYSDYYKNMSPFIERLMQLSWATPERISKLILKVIKTENPPLWVPATFDALIFYYVRRLLPRRLLQPVLFGLLPGARKWGEGYSKRRK